MPVIGFLDPTSLDKYAPFVEAFRNGLREVGLIAGHNLAIEFRWAEGQYAPLRMARVIHAAPSTVRCWWRDTSQICLTLPVSDSARWLIRNA